LFKGCTGIPQVYSEEIYTPMQKQSDWEIDKTCVSFGNGQSAEYVCEQNNLDMNYFYSNEVCNGNPDLVVDVNPPGDITQGSFDCLNHDSFSSDFFCNETVTAEYAIFEIYDSSEPFCGRDSILATYYIILEKCVKLGDGVNFGDGYCMFFFFFSFLKLMYKFIFLKGLMMRIIYHSNNGKMEIVQEQKTFQLLLIYMIVHGDLIEEILG
jgi:hypothetical protein